MGTLTFIALVVTALTVGFVVATITSVVLTKMFIPPGEGRVIVNAELFRIIWSPRRWLGHQRPGFGLCNIVADLLIAGCCLELVGTIGVAFIVASVAGGVVAAVALTVVFFKL